MEAWGVCGKYNSGNLTIASADLGQDMSGEIVGNDLEDRIMIREEQWEQLEAERESLQEERKKLNANETE